MTEQDKEMIARINASLVCYKAKINAEGKGHFELIEMIREEQEWLKGLLQRLK